MLFCLWGPWSRVPILTGSLRHFGNQVVFVRLKVMKSARKQARAMASVPKGTSGTTRRIGGISGIIGAACDSGGQGVCPSSKITAMAISNSAVKAARKVFFLLLIMVCLPLSLHFSEACV